MGSTEDFQWKDIHCGKQLNFICQLGWAYTTVMHSAIYCTLVIPHSIVFLGIDYSTLRSLGAGDDMQRVYFYSTKKDRTLE